ncbi:MAG: MBL fold metallo-hydrolase [Clostridia bacterium]
MISEALVSRQQWLANVIGKNKTKKQKRIINIIIVVLVIVVLAMGCLYYFDIEPFDIVLGNNTDFKYYKVGEVGDVPNILASASGDLRIHYIDVNQGDSILIQLPDGKNMLIDGGDRDSKVASCVINYLLSDKVGLKRNSNNAITLDYVLLTHCDSDHCGSLDDIIASSSIDVKSVYRPRVLSKHSADPLKSVIEQEKAQNVQTISTTVYYNFVDSIVKEVASGILSENDIHYNLQGNHIDGVGYTLNFYNPKAEMYDKLASAQDKNNISPIIVLTYNSATPKRILLTGDADEKAEQNFVDNVNANLFSDSFSGDIDVLKVAHHGGEESSNDFFLGMAKPEYAVISVGEGNKYNHPREVSLSRLSTYVSTDKNGSVVMTIGATGEIVWTSEKAQQAKANLSVADITLNLMYTQCYNYAI